MTQDDRMETITDPAQIRATDEADERNTTIVGMVDDLGRPATIYTPPEVLRRDPARWPTPAEFVSEWEQHSPERRLYLAERILSDAQKVERLDEAIDRARWERAQAEDAETEATARAEAAEAEVVTLRAKLTAVEAELAELRHWTRRDRPRLIAATALAFSRPMILGDFDIRASDLRAALATTGEDQ